jgi:hypothetical protein
MAGALNVFKTITADLTTSGNVVYTAVPGYATVVLMAQISNIDSSNTVDVSAAVNRTVGNAFTTTFLVKDVAVPTQDAISVLTGRLIMIEGDELEVLATANSHAQLTLSLLETLTA